MGTTGSGTAHRLRQALAVLGIALFFAVLEAAQGRFLYSGYTARQFWPEALARSLPSWLIMALLFPAILFLARRFPIDEDHWRLSLPVHLVAGFAIVFLQIAGASWIAALRGVTVSSFQAAFLHFITIYLVMGFFLYATIVAAVQIARQRKDLAEARLEALRHQLNPHFLFNTLNSISALALTGDRDTLVRAVDALSDLLRVVLRESAGATTTLAAEMEFLDRYSEIQTIRFGDRLKVERHVDAETNVAMVPALVLQPLVENAVQHGVGTQPGPGWVAIRARRDREWLHLEVEDSGPGFHAGDGETGGNGLGLRNTRSRLRQLYGKLFELTCGNGPGGGARVVIRIPWSTRLAESDA